MEPDDLLPGDRVRFRLSYVRASAIATVLETGTRGIRVYCPVSDGPQEIGPRWIDEPDRIEEILPRDLRIVKTAADLVAGDVVTVHHAGLAQNVKCKVREAGWLVLDPIDVAEEHRGAMFVPPESVLSWEAPKR